MKIYSMTATFGKLSHETLQLSNGLNIVHAPNEWGKSTWCAFITAMLYGIDTRQQSNKTQLADKERFLPWSGEPISGRMELCWNGMDITIERSTRGRIPFGEFRAYETATGLDVPELTATNCGQQLLGVEKEVFHRSGFIRLQDMPVTQDDKLRRRLNSLVTTGDESGAGDNLGKQLKELKNKVKFNRSGLLPQAEYEREQIRSKLQQQQELQQQIQDITARQGDLEQQIRDLENHADALRYEAAKQSTVRIQEAQAACALAEKNTLQLEAACSELPSEEEAQRALQAGRNLLAKQNALRSQQQALPQKPIAPEIPPQYQGITPEQTIANAEADFRKQTALENAVKKQAKQPMLYGICAMLLITIAVVLYFAVGLDVLILSIAGATAALGCAIGIALSVAQVKANKNKLEELAKKYPGIAPPDWASYAQKYQTAQLRYQLALEQYSLSCGDFSAAQTALEQEIQSYAGERSLDEAAAYWEDVLAQHQQLTLKRRELKSAREHTLALQSVATAAPEPAFPDRLTLSQQETESQLHHCLFEQKQLQIKLGQSIGQAETMEPEDMLKAQLDTLSRRIGRLEDYYRALELAQEVLYQATSALQRRFAPRISKQAQNYFSRLTDGRYQRITLSDDLSLHASAQNEDTLRSTQWRSDGTVDQLYLSLRLAVAGELTPEAPLVLDDALLRFDDERLKAALTVLQEAAEAKQVILFSCQSREKDLLT